MAAEKPKKKLLTGPLLSGPIALLIMALGGLLIFAVSRIISPQRSYRDLVREMQSRTFGNRWISAFELAKKISSSSIAPEEIPWLIDSLSHIYTTSVDPRTRDFIVVALSALNDERALPVLSKALDDANANVKFHAIVGLANLENIPPADQEKLEAFLDSPDTILVHAAILALATHGSRRAEEKLSSQLSHPEVSIRYAAATALVHYQNPKAVPLLHEILQLRPIEALNHGLDENKLIGLKINVLMALQRSGWRELEGEVRKLIEQEENLKILSEAKKTLEILRNSA